ncbi:Ferredoxin--NADP reductase [uncultured archaeon]|nr:Ferredoxin--NADP reductase [uncultured archaeon]
MTKKDVIIIGAGASGMMCAIESGKRGRSVLVLDHASRIGEKIRISGGGNCNFTNISTSSANYLSNNPHFCKSALSRFTPRDIISLLEKHGVKYAEREHGQLFCTKSGEEITRMLREESNDARVNIVLNCRILNVKKEDSYIVSTDRGIFESRSLVIASGGLSYPGIGASGIGYRIAKQFGLKITGLKPGLVPFFFSPEDRAIFGDLSGISIDAAVKCNNMEFRESILFTHRGLSGPAILQISSYWEEGDTLVIDLLPGIDIYGISIAQSKSKIDMHNLLSQYLPSRFAKIWFISKFQSRPVNQYNDKELRNIASQVHNWEVKPESTGGFETAEVTLGGIDTSELSSKTMESRCIKGLYFAGEVVDVTGQLGGYNLQWAWASGFVAGQYA